jgi:hypothetical protein
LRIRSQVGIDAFGGSGATARIPSPFVAALRSAAIELEIASIPAPVLI